MIDKKPWQQIYLVGRGEENSKNLHAAEEDTKISILHRDL